MKDLFVTHRFQVSIFKVTAVSLYEPKVQKTLVGEYASAFDAYHRCEACHLARQAGVFSGVHYGADILVGTGCFFGNAA